MRAAQGRRRCRRPHHADHLAHGPLDDQQKAALADIAEKTPVTKTIKAGATIETKFL